MAPSGDANAPAILLVDYDVVRLARLRTLLEAEEHRVVVARDSSMAAAAADPKIGVLVLADEMQLVPTRRLLGALRRHQPALQLVLLASERSGQLSRDTLERLGVHGYVADPDGDERMLRAVEAALRTHRMLADAQASERLKMELLASVSHEFRSPLHVVLGYVDLAREGAFGSVSDPLTEMLDKVAWNAAHLLEVVEDFLDLAKAEATAKRAEHVDVARLVRALVVDHELLVQGRPVVLRSEVHGTLPLAVAEPAKLRIVVQNLLANAVKFTERGEVVVAAESPLPGVLQVRVRDTGPGIPAEAHERIFELFEQLQPGAMGTKGSGVGLALARRFARAMGGDLTVASVPGAGATFTLTLPAVVADEPGRDTAAVPAGGGVPRP